MDFEMLNTVGQEQGEPDGDEASQMTLDSMNYSGPDKRCGTCTNFDGSQCSLANQPVTEDGTCDKHSANGETPNYDDENESEFEAVEEI